MGPGIIIPVAVLAVAIPVTLGVTRRRFKQVAAGIGPDLGHATDPAVRLTSDALRVLGTPPWRVVHEIGRQRLGGIDHVVIGPPGVLPILTTIEPLPSAPSEGEEDPAAVAEAAVMRGDVDDALRRCAMSTERLVVVHWGISRQPEVISVETLPGVVAVDGRAVQAWLDALDGERLSPAQVDLAWQTIVTAIGRPDPLK
jgi:hypothetical protein